MSVLPAVFFVTKTNCKMFYKQTVIVLTANAKCGIISIARLEVENIMKIVGERLKELRVNARYSQKQIAELCETTQVTIGRYETGVAEPPLERLLWYADFFSVSLDYIFGRTDNPNGMQKRSALKAALAEPGSAEQLMALCFTPGTPFNERLKETVARMLREVKEE